MEAKTLVSAPEYLSTGGRPDVDYVDGVPVDRLETAGGEIRIGLAEIFA